MRHSGNLLSFLLRCGTRLGQKVCAVFAKKNTLNCIMAIVINLNFIIVKIGVFFFIGSNIQAEKKAAFLEIYASYFRKDRNAVNGKCI